MESSLDMTQALANLNGVIQPLAEVRVSALDRGFLFGDAVYEGIRVYDGRVWLLDRHWDRLGRSLEAIRIRGVDLGRLRQRMLETLRTAGFREAFIYVQITRGVAPTRTHAFPEHSVPTEFLFVEPYHDVYGARRQSGIAVVTFSDLRWKRCDIKTVNLLGNVLGAQTAREAGAQEALLHRDDGAITEATRSSFFAIRDGRLITSPQSPAILPGVTRNYVLELAADQGIPVEERYLTLAELPRMDELFLTGTGAEVLPIVQVDGAAAGGGRLGPVTERLQQAYRAAVRRWLESGPAGAGG